jgi:hypothetical protein
MSDLVKRESGGKMCIFIRKEGGKGVPVISVRSEAAEN